MNLDDLELIRKVDADDMLSHIKGLPDQLRAAWKLGLDSHLPWKGGMKNVIIAGMGGSAIGGDLLAAYATPLCPVPVFVNRDYHLPAWAGGEGTLAVASSHSGNTEETLSAFEQALERGCRSIVISTGGKLTQKALSAGIPAWVFEHHGMPRAAVGFSFGLLLALFFRLGLLPDPGAGVDDAVEAMKEQQQELLPEVPFDNNPAKQLAQRLVDRWVMVIGSGYMAPVARRWKGQINELAKAWAQFEVLPEADHNTLAGAPNPGSIRERNIVLFLRSSLDHPHNSKRSALTQEVFRKEGVETRHVDAEGGEPLAQMWTTLLLGDYTAYYLAMIYQVDPTPISALVDFKEAMKR